MPSLGTKTFGKIKILAFLSLALAILAILTSSSFIVLLVPGTVLSFTTALIVIYAAHHFFWKQTQTSATKELGIVQRFEFFLEQLGLKLHDWAQKSEHLQTFSDSHIGWLQEQYPRLHQQSSDLTLAFKWLLRDLPKKHYRRSLGLIRRPLSREMLDKHLPLSQSTVTDSWSKVTFLLIPGLFTKWYPLYFSSVKKDLCAMGFQYHYSEIDTHKQLVENLDILRGEITRLYRKYGHKIVLVGHSKGAVDGLEALIKYPELEGMILSLVSLQGPFGGSPISTDLHSTVYQKSLAIATIRNVLIGDHEALFELSYLKRKELFTQYMNSLGDSELPIWQRVPTLCLTSSGVSQKSAVLSPIIEYLRYRYNQPSDGLVFTKDQLLPGTKYVQLDDMDHFGPVWYTFPALDVYDPSRLLFICVWLSLQPNSPHVTQGDGDSSVLHYF